MGKVKEIEVELTNLVLDYGYGDWDAELSATVTQTDSGQYEIKDCTVWFIDQDGGIFKEDSDFEPDKDLEQRILNRAKEALV